MEDNNEFEPVSAIETRQELALIFNALYDEKKLLGFKKRNPERQKAISAYLKELDIRYEELKGIERKIATETRAKYLKEEKEKKAQFMREHTEGLAHVAEDIQKYNVEKEELENQKKAVKKQIADLEIELKIYSKKIGLDNLREECKKLEEKQKTHQIKTCCKHIKYRYFERKSDMYDEDIINTYMCFDCGFKFDDDSTIYSNLQKMKIFRLY
jgi:DNA-directed RNA polymerase subunit M/transcription elongation factor TFIIS